MTEHKAGFVNIIGKPNVGKSTLMNALMGEKLSIITPKAQTTRHRIKGIINTDDYQIVFSDTPGILKSAYLLQEKMMEAVDNAFADADVMIYLIETGEKNIDEDIALRLKKIDVPLFLVINKIDLIDQKKLEDYVKYWREHLPTAEIIPISAQEKFNIDYLLKRILHFLPKSPPYYDKDQLTDRPERFFVAEIIREKIFFHYKKEIPYSVEVIIESFKEEENIIKIMAVINVERESQKGIIIGHKGDAIKRVGTEARIDMEKFLDKKVFLEMRVKVKDDWRSNPNFLKNFGYDNY
jgi:GTPase